MINFAQVFYLVAVPVYGFYSFSCRAPWRNLIPFCIPAERRWSSMPFNLNAVSPVTRHCQLLTSFSWVHINIWYCFLKLHLGELWENEKCILSCFGTKWQKKSSCHLKWYLRQSLYTATQREGLGLRGPVQTHCHSKQVYAQLTLS